MHGHAPHVSFHGRSLVRGEQILFSFPCLSRNETPPREECRVLGERIRINDVSNHQREDRRGWIQHDRLIIKFSFSSSHFILILVTSFQLRVAPFFHYFQETETSFKSLPTISVSIAFVTKVTLWAKKWGIASGSSFRYRRFLESRAPRSRQARRVFSAELVVAETGTALVK